MPIDAFQMYTAAQFTPDFYGSAIGDAPTEAEQIAQAVAFIDLEVLPLANSEVEVPVRKALKDMVSPLDNAGITTLFGHMAPSVIKLWDAAQTSYGRSELNKRVKSDNEERDKDSDQDRIQGNDRLKKLLDFVVEWVALQPGGDEQTESLTETTQSVETVFVW
ncbi:hypothetical protein EON83_12575 [bacterium]|nr:MAG: hypothetical protein EON83_12575 [bacterium]